MSDEKVEVTFSASISGLVSGLKEMVTETKESVEQMKLSFEGLHGSLERLKSGFLMFTALAGGGELFEKTIEHTAELGVALEQTGQKTGMATEDLSRMAYAAKMTDVDVYLLMRGMTNLAMNMERAATGTGTSTEAFERLGISTEDSAGKLRPMNDVMLDLAEKFSKMENGTAKTALAIDIFGRRAGPQLIPYLNQGKEGLAALNAEADKLGFTMSEKDVEAANRYVDANKRLHAALDGCYRVIALNLMPALTDISRGLTSIFATTNHNQKQFSFLGETFKFIAKAALECYAAVNALVETVKFLYTLLMTPVNRQWFTNIKQAFSDMADHVTAVNERVANSLLKINGFGGEANNPTKPDGLGGEGDPGPVGMASKDMLAEAERRWKMIADTSTKGHDDLLLEEVDFWKQQIALVRGNGQAEQKVREEMRNRALGALHKYNDDEQKAEAIRTNIQRDAALERLDLEKSNVADMQQAREIDAAMAADQYRRIADAAVQIQLEQISAEEALSQGDLAKLAQLAAKKEQILRAHGRTMIQINKDETKSIENDWLTVFQRVQDGMAASFKGWLEGTATFTDSLKNVFRNALAQFVAYKANELKVHVAHELAKKQATVLSVTERYLAEAAGALKSVALSAWSALMKIGHYAAVAAAGAWAALSGIPIVGPFLGAAAAGAALAGVLALGHEIASASGGFDVPPNVNPMTQLHAREMVLPAELADRVRGLTGGGGSGGGAPINVTVTAMDAKDVRRVLLDHPGALADAIHSAARGGHLDARKTGLPV